LKALGRAELPADIQVQGRIYHREHVYKNDFFAATALYVGDAGKVVLKVQRTAAFCLIPLGWLGWILARREEAMLKHLEGLEGVPRFLERWGRTGLTREFIEGSSLSSAQRVPDDFHPRLARLIEALHARGMAYVDLEKRDNVVVGVNGLPYLIDFQISWYWPRRWGGELWPARLTRGWLQTGDRYHLLKLWRRTRPDQLTSQQRAASYRKPWFVRNYSRVTRPLTLARRWILDHVDPRPAKGERGRVQDPAVIGVAKQCH
jgi:hypothetical protein